MREGGAEALSFDVIVASGPNAALPHHHPGARRIGAGETVVVDAGAKVDGYCSDCTRTFATGPLPGDLRARLRRCRRPRRRRSRRSVPGADARGLDAIARLES